MVEECHFWVLFETDLSLVVAYKDDGWVETCQEGSDNPVDKVLFEDIEAGVVGQDEGKF